MERKVIKFNLMGAIGVLILIIAFVIGITVFITNKSNSENKNKKQSQQQIQENRDDYKEVNEKQSVQINGQKIEYIVKPFESKLKYKINLPSEKFYFEGNTEGKDIFKSLESDSISMEIFKNDTGFKYKSEELIVNEAQRMKDNKTYKLKAINLNGRLCYIEQEELSEELYLNYYIENKEEYYTIKVRCDNSFSVQLIPILDNMIKSFKIM